MLRGKPTKADAFKSLRALLDDDAPRPRKPAQSHLDWVARAVLTDKKDRRTSLKYLYSHGDVMVGTNGHRIHIIPTTLSEGFYSSNAPFSAVDGSQMTPIPDIRTRYDFKETVAAVYNVHDLEIIDIDQDTIGARLPHGPVINREYLIDAVGDRYTVKVLNADQGKHDPVMIEGSYGIAFIMPIRL